VIFIADKLKAAIKASRSALQVAARKVAVDAGMSSFWTGFHEPGVEVPVFCSYRMN